MASLLALLLIYGCFLQFLEPGHFDSPKNPNENSISKRQKLCSDDAGEECLDSKENESATANSGDGMQFIFYYFFCSFGRWNVV